MNSRLPSTLHHKRGFRSTLLRRLPSTWLNAATARDFGIPDIKPPAIEAIYAELAIPFSFDAPLLPTPAVQHTSVALPPPNASQIPLRWEVVCLARNVPAFQVVVHGIRYRNLQKSEEEQVDEANIATPIAKLSQKAEKSQKTKHPYAHLYGLLYPPPEDFAGDQLPMFGELRPYQKAGVEFLVSREHALLADDMGLGKTAQCAIALAILRRTERVGRALIICPRAVIKQWQQEAKHWAGIHTDIVDATPGRRGLFWAYSKSVLLATPHIVLKDMDIIERQQFDLVVCDDVTMLKNPSSQITRAIRSIPRSRSWCLNGTPLENKPEDFANVMQFVNPGLFTATEREVAPSSYVLQERVKPFFLRRRKTECLKDLPPKQLIGPLELELSGEQWRAYRQFEQGQWDAYRALGSKPEKIHIFALITRLIQVCNFDKESKQSAKADAVEEQLEQILASQQSATKAIVFSRFVETLNYLATRYTKFRPLIYHGQLSQKEREAILAKFRREGCLLLMSTKAGARGLNLQEASYVFHFDRGWNPVDEMQAEDRCWRFGQKQNVSVYRYLQVRTIEERIHHT